MMPRSSSGASKLAASPPSLASPAGQALSKHAATRRVTLTPGSSVEKKKKGGGGTKKEKKEEEEDAAEEDFEYEQASSGSEDEDDFDSSDGGSDSGSENEGKGQPNLEHSLDWSMLKLLGRPMTAAESVLALSTVLHGAGNGEMRYRAALEAVMLRPPVPAEVEYIMNRPDIVKLEERRASTEDGDETDDDEETEEEEEEEQGQEGDDADADAAQGPASKKTRK